MWPWNKYEQKKKGVNLQDKPRIQSCLGLSLRISAEIARFFHQVPSGKLLL
jgi:hypothetical protein